MLNGLSQSWFQTYAGRPAQVSGGFAAFQANPVHLAGSLGAMLSVPSIRYDVLQQLEDAVDAGAFSGADV